MNARVIKTCALRALYALALCLLLSVAVGACSKPAKAPASQATKVTPVAAHKATEPTERGRWDCAQDADCQNSCRYGAVSKAWYRAHQKTLVECEDGCANQISGPPKCIDKQCAAFDNKGKPRSYCTKRKVSRR